MSALSLLIRYYNLKGGPIHKPYWLSWTSLPYLFFNFLYFVCMEKMIINNKQQLNEQLRTKENDIKRIHDEEMRTAELLEKAIYSYR